MKEGDFIKLDFDAFVKETDLLMDTTHEDVAKEHDVYNERATYTPVSVIVGSGHVIKGLDESLKEAKVGKDMEIEIDAKDAYGDRDPKLIEVFPMNKILSLPEFRKGDTYPNEGMELRINNRIGYINRIFAGRVRIDFNNRFAGRTLVYKYKVTEVIKKKDEKVKALVEAVYPNTEEFEFNFKGKDEVEITLPDVVKLDQNWAMAKFKLVSDLRAHMDLKTIKLIEVYVKKEEIKEEEHTHECDDPDCKHDHSKEEVHSKDCSDPDCKHEDHKAEEPKEEKKAPAKKKTPTKKSSKKEEKKEEKKE